MSNYPNRPFFYNFLSAFRPYAASKPASSSVTSSTTGAFSTPTQAASQNAASSSMAGPSSPTSTHAQITQAATARAIASKSSTTGQTQGFAQAAAAFSPPSHHHHAKHTSPSPARRPPSTPYGSQGFGGRNRRGSDSSGDEGFVQKPGADKWFVGGRIANGEERFYKLSMVRRERSNDRKSCDRMSL